MSPHFKSWLLAVKNRLPAMPRIVMPRLALPVKPVLLVVVSTASVVWLVQHPPVQQLAAGQVAVRVNQFSGAASSFSQGFVKLPGLHHVRVFDLRDRIYHPSAMASAQGSAPLQSIEGLSVGADISVRYGLDAGQLLNMAKQLPDDIDSQIVEPAVQATLYKAFARYTVREIFSTKRLEIQQTIEQELTSKLAADGIVLRAVWMGKVDLPADYKRGMEGLLAEELASEKMRFTLELKDKQVQESALQAEAEKVRRQKQAEAAAQEQIIAAKAEEDAMKHVLPFKQRQIEQRKLEAEAERVSAIKRAEGNAQARQIEAAGEAQARQKLADAEAYRLTEVGKAGAEQMAREGRLLSQHPLLIQKTLADKLADKVQVIIAPPGEGFIGANLLGKAAPASVSADMPEPAAASVSESGE